VRSISSYNLMSSAGPEPVARLTSASECLPSAIMNVDLTAGLTNSFRAKFINNHAKVVRAFSKSLRVLR